MSLSNDVLSVVFDFLASHEWRQLRIWNVSQQWRTLAIKAKSRGLRLKDPTTGVLQNLISSSLRHHVTSVEVYAYEPSRMELAGQLTWIKHLLLKKVTASVHFAPLMKLQNLQYLNCAGAELCSQQIECVKQMSGLISLRQMSESLQKMPHWNASMLQLLCAPPHQLQRLQSIGLDETCMVKDEYWYSLKNLPSLTQLNPASLSLSSLELVKCLPHLTHLRISLPFNGPVVPVLSYLEHFGRIETLEIEGTILAAMYQSDPMIMQCMTSMTHMIVIRLESTAFLSGLPSAPVLSCLIFHCQVDLDTLQLAALADCHLLTSLSLKFGYWIPATLDVDRVMGVLPRLTSCSVDYPRGNLRYWQY